MQEEVQKELEAVRGMVLAWKQSYLQDAGPEEGGEFLALELLQEIEDQVYPYVRRMYDSSYVTQTELQEFMQSCYNIVDDLRGPSGAAEIDEEQIIWPPGNEKESYGPH